MQILTTWISAHAGLVALLIPILACIILVDHTLASSNWFKSNSTAQAFFKWSGKASLWALKVFSPATEAQVEAEIAAGDAAAPAPAPAQAVPAPASAPAPTSGAPSA